MNFRGRVVVAAVVGGGAIEVTLGFTVELLGFVVGLLVVGETAVVVGALVMAVVVTGALVSLLLLW